MIKVISAELEKNYKSNTQRLTFPLKVSRNVWLTDDKLVLEYPLEFDHLQNIGEAVVFSLLSIAYRESSNIELPNGLTIEKGTQGRIDEICELWNKWFSCNRRVIILAREVDPFMPNGKIRFGAQLFSGGVDSTASFKRHGEKVEYLVLYKGADIPVTRPKLFEKVKKYTQDFAQDQNKKLITLSTNVHYLGAASWEYMSHACSMIGPLLSLSYYIDRVYIAATHSGRWAREVRLGSHPELDPKVSIDSIETIHDGFELKRPDKIKLIAKEKALISKLRVCGNIDYFDKNNGNVVNRYNCGECEKCNYTAMILSLLGITHQEAPFPKHTFSLRNTTLFLDQYKENLKKQKGLKIEWSQCLEFLESSKVEMEGKEELRLALEKTLGDFYTDYKKGFPEGSTIRDISKWRKLERLFGLKPDTLEWLKKAKRSLKGRSYRKFIQECSQFTKVY